MANWLDALKEILEEANDVVNYPLENIGKPGAGYLLYGASESLDEVGLGGRVSIPTLPRNRVQPGTGGGGPVTIKNNRYGPTHNHSHGDRYAASQARARRLHESRR